MSKAAHRLPLLFRQDVHDGAEDLLNGLVSVVLMQSRCMGLGKFQPSACLQIENEIVCSCELLRHNRPKFDGFAVLDDGRFGWKEHKEVIERGDLDLVPTSATHASRVLSTLPNEVYRASKGMFVDGRSVGAKGQSVVCKWWRGVAVHWRQVISRWLCVVRRA